MIQKPNTMEPYNDTSEAYLHDRDQVVLLKGDEKQSVQGHIVKVSDANIVSISDYHGSGISDIKGSDIYAINDTVVSLFCKEAMQVSNRITVDLQSGTSVEISGQIEGCRSNMSMND